jgi:hypothetical protein
MLQIIHSLWLDTSYPQTESGIDCSILKKASSMDTADYGMLGAIVALLLGWYRVARASLSPYDRH